MPKSAPAIALLVVLVPVFAAWSDEEVLPGHSHFGEAFNRGSRRGAYLMGGTGNVHFPVSSQKPLVQKFIEQGIGQLHGFWYREAERSFREAARLDPNCGIAYWGMSQAAIVNKTRAAQFAAEALKHRQGLSQREQLYLDALSNGSAYRDLIAKYPDDLEAKAFEVWRQWHLAEAKASQPGDLEDALKLAHDILRVDPLHPIHHAVIHITDSQNAFRRGLDSAAKCGEAAPSIGHMWHMPTHIYASLKRYPSAAWQLEACLRTNNARAMHDRVLPYEVELYAHNNEWLTRMLMHLGRVHDARRVAKEMIDLPRHPLFNLLEPPDDAEKKRATETKGKSDSAVADESGQDQTRESHGTSAYYGRERLMQLLRRFECWQELIDDCKSGYLEATRLPAEQGKYHTNLGVAYYSRGEIAKGDEELAAVHKVLEEQVALRIAAVEEVDQRPAIERPGALGAVEKRFNRPLRNLQSQARQLEDYRRIAAGCFLSRGRLLIDLGGLVAVEAAVFWFLRKRMSRAILSAIAATLLGGWLISCHIALLNIGSDSTNVDFAFVTQKQLAEGDFDLAEWSARQFATDRPLQVRPQANLVEVLYKAGKRKEARAEFEILRELAGTADLDSPPLARLAPIAREFGLPTDWRKPEKIKELLGDRRPLPSLGPLEWRPWSAPDWKLTDAAGGRHELHEFQGKPIILTFFLGRGCLHCQQQLAGFAKKAAEFKEAGLTVIAVSTDDQAGAKKSAESFPAGGVAFPFMMLADPKLDVFRSYGAFDDFEQVALHGTYLIDGTGLVRWNDVSFEPFMNADFLLSESKRLLARPVAPIEPEARVLAADSP
jgi:peroxiredoxin/tetratricopeptide (TPR) repeat protein